MKDCVFCRILNNELPSYPVYEDDKVIAILDQRPIYPGCTMVIPRHHCEHFVDLPDDLAAHIVIVGNKIGQKIKKVFNPLRVGFVVAGFGVSHVHYHVIPQYKPHDITSSQYAPSGTIFDLDYVPVATDQERHNIMTRLRDA